MAVKRTKVMQAYELAAPVRSELHKIGRVMEVTEDKVGILWERWLIQRDNKFANIILFATPHWAEVFAPLTEDQTWQATIDAIKSLTIR